MITFVSEKILLTNIIPMKKIMLIIVACLWITISFAQEEKSDNVKTGWTFGALPAIAYDTDLGFKYGALVNLFYYGDGSTYPKYLHSIYYELSTTTKGSTLSKFYYDSDQLLKNYYLRLTASFNYIRDRAFDFYGFNGYNSVYIPEYAITDSDEYLTRMFYRLERARTNVSIDFQGAITDKNFRWIGGFGYFNYALGSVDIDRLNKGKEEDEMLPPVNEVPGLWEKYCDWNVIPEAEQNGGSFDLFKAGLVYDTRDNEANPNRGLWTEAIISASTGLLGSFDKGFSKITLTHRQYFTLWKNRLTFAYRVGYQQTLSGTSPHYFEPYMASSWPGSAYSEGLGGGRSLRGILRNRVVGNGTGYANIELRYKIFKTVLLNQNLYIALSPFMDMGQVFVPYDINTDNVPDAVKDDWFTTEEGLHTAAGLGVYVALNENFILAVNHGRALDKRDGTAGTYINIGFLF